MQSDIDSAQLQRRLTAIHKRMENACRFAGRRATDVRLLLATKTVDADRIAMAAQLGECMIGENKVQELKIKDEVLAPLQLERHFIGHLQTNKVKDVLQYAGCVQTLDRIGLAEALQQRLETETRMLDVMVQVNTSNEESKFGLAPEHTPEFIRKLHIFPNLRVTGLMTIGLFDADPERVRPGFAGLRELREEILREGLLDAAEFRHLSMGMSGDLEVAIQEGATIVRVGTAIFGSRNLPDSYYWNENIES